MNGFTTSGSTFVGATPPSWMAGLSQYASPEEWRTQGTAFIRNPLILKQRYDIANLGRFAAEQEANRPIFERQADIQRRQLSIESSMFNPSEYSAQIKQQRDYEKAQRNYEMRKLQFQNQALDWKRQMMGRFGFGGMGGFGGFGQGGSREYSPQSSLALTPMAGKPSWMNSYSTPKFPA